jgi:hypothetical protein
MLVGKNPESGQYIVRICTVRDFAGKYEKITRPHITKTLARNNTRNIIHNVNFLTKKLLLTQPTPGLANLPIKQALLKENTVTG